MRLPSDPRQSRILAVGLLLALLVLAYFVGLHWWFVAPHMALREQAIELREQEFELRKTAQQRPAVEARMREVRAFEASNPGFLNETNFDLAAAALITRLETVLQEHGGSGCSVITRTPFRSREQERFQRVTVKVRMRCEMAEFGRVLHALEGGSPMLFVEALSINRRGTLGGRPGTAQQSYLDIAFDLSGYLRQKGAEA